MMTKSFAAAAFSTALLLLGQASARAQMRETTANPAVITVRVGAPAADGARVPETLFGTFLEPIGNSINQGLSAEILVNGSLEEGLWNQANLAKIFAEQPEVARANNDPGLPVPWQPLSASAGRRYEVHRGAAANSWQSVEIMGFPGAPVGILERVDLPAPRELNYHASVYVRHLAGSPQVTVLLRKHGSTTVLAQASFAAQSGEWTRYSVALKLAPGAVAAAEPVDFGVAVEADERVDVDELSLMPDDAVDGMDPEVIAMIRAMHSSILRLGGNFSSQYHWRAGVGPADKRLVEQNTPWGIPEYNTFGTDEFLRLCQLLQVVPQIDLNLGSGTPEEAADWVRYIGEHYKGKVIYELGNELYGNWQVGHLRADEIGARTLAFSQAVRAVAPDAEIMATGEQPQSFREWNAALLKDPPGTFDLISTHFIRVTNQVSLAGATPEFVAAAAYALPVGLSRDLAAMQQQLDGVPGLASRVHFAMDEWLFNSRVKNERVNISPSSKNEGGALIVAGVFNTLLRQSRIVPVSTITGTMEFAGVWKEHEQVYGTPSYYTFQLYQRVQGQTVLPVASDSGSYEVHGAVEGFTDMTGVPYVDSVATESADGQELTVFCVNRALDKGLPVRLDLGVFNAAAEVKVDQLSSASRYDTNDGPHPRRVVPQASVMKLPASEPLTFTLPRESLTVLHFTKRAANGQAAAGREESKQGESL